MIDSLAGLVTQLGKYTWPELHVYPFQRCGEINASHDMAAPLTRGCNTQTCCGCGGPL